MNFKSASRARSIFVLLAALLPAACSSETSWSVVDRLITTSYPDVEQITADSLAARLQAADRPEPLLLDVRTSDEFAVSHLNGALRVDPEQPDFALLDSLDRTYPIVTYCSVGYRSAELAERLQELGFEDVSNLKGSIFRWANEGRPVYRDSVEVRQVHPYDRAWGRLLDRELHAYEPGG